ncbi:MAG: hypothetical protein ACYTGH_02455 [Planctomycetota bacterium]
MVKSPSSKRRARRKPATKEGAPRSAAPRTHSDVHKPATEADTNPLKAISPPVPVSGEHGLAHTLGMKPRPSKARHVSNFFKPITRRKRRVAVDPLHPAGTPYPHLQEWLTHWGPPILLGLLAAIVICSL